MDEEARSQLVEYGFASFTIGLEKFGVTSFRDIAALHRVDFEELGMSRVQLRKLQQLCVFCWRHGDHTRQTCGLVQCARAANAHVRRRRCSIARRSAVAERRDPHSRINSTCPNHSCGAASIGASGSCRAAR